MPVPYAVGKRVELYIDDELGREGFTYTLRSGAEDSVMMDRVLDHKAMRHEGVAKREIARRLGTSATQIYRLLDTTNYTKSVDAMLDLLHVLGLEVDVTVRPRRGGSTALKGASVCADADAADYGA